MDSQQSIQNIILHMSDIYMCVLIYIYIYTSVFVKALCKLIPTNIMSGEGSRKYSLAYTRILSNICKMYYFTCMPFTYISELCYLTEDEL